MKASITAVVTSKLEEPSCTSSNSACPACSSTTGNDASNAKRCSELECCCCCSCVHRRCLSRAKPMEFAAWANCGGAVAGPAHPVVPCASVQFDASFFSYSARKMRPKTLEVSDRPIRLSPGSHAFVRITGERYFRVALIGSIFGEACGHRQLANEQPVLYAGEIEFGGSGECIRWSNLSGTYQCPDRYASQAGMPSGLFWAVRMEAPDVLSSSWHRAGVAWLHNEPVCASA